MKNNLLKGGFILFIGMNILNLGNYIFNVLMGHMLGPADYGIFVSLMALLTIISVPSGVLQTIAIKFTSVFLAKGEKGKIKFLLDFLSKKTILLSAIAFLLLIAFSYPLSKFLNIANPYPLFFLSFSMLVLFLLPINRGILQGLQEFTSYSINLILEPIIKIILSVLLIIWGFKVNGAIAAYVLSIFLVYLFSFWFLKNVIKQKETRFDARAILKYSLPVLVGFFLINLLSSVDILVVKHYFNSQQAGLYSCLSTIAKIVLYFSLPFVSAMFPKISELFTKEKKHFAILAQTFGIVAVLSLVIMIVFTMFPDIIVKLLFGAQYLPISPYLGKMSLAMFLLILINVFFNYYFSIGKYKFIFYFFIFSVCEIILMVLFHSNFNQIINSIIATYGGLILCLGISYIWSKKEQIIYAINNNSRLQ
jgi:O-antigen/teichoic acid export membrane protein